jgi:polyisoprenoid-binding protein YceI
MPNARLIMMNVANRIPVLVFGLLTVATARAQQATLNFAPQRTAVNFTLGDVLHTVRGAFALKSGIVQFNPATNAISGRIVIDATSGDSGSTARDHKMHKEILLSERYTEVTFRPDRVEGRVLQQGTSTVNVHGMFGILGAEHEIVVPAEVELAPDHWTLKTHFDVPYVKWGLKDPSTFILRVGKTVAIDLSASGTSPWPGNPQ